MTHSKSKAKVQLIVGAQRGKPHKARPLVPLNGVAHEVTPAVPYSNGHSEAPAPVELLEAAALPEVELVEPEVEAVEAPVGAAQPRRAGARRLLRMRDWLWVWPFGFAVLAGVFFILRYGGYWTETDSASFTQLIRSMANAGRLVPSNGEVYPNGFTYQAISVFIMGVTGLDVLTLQQIVYPLLAALVVLPAWMLYRELTSSRIVATLGTLLLLMQPEFLFVVLRSSHEKFTRLLMLLALFWLVRSFRVRPRAGIFIALFYLTTFALITSNNLLANSFIFAVTVALVLGWALTRINPNLHIPGGHILLRLSYATFICLGLVYLFTFYAYLPAAHDVEVLRDIWTRVSALLLDTSVQATDAYAQVQAGWISLPVYFLLSSANWIVLAASLVIWLWQAREWIIKRVQPPSLQSWLLWLLYAAFAVQGMASVLVDASGAVGTNLQHRTFPSFSLIAVPLVAAGLVRWRPPRLFPNALKAGLAVAAALIALGSLLKAINEPLLSNKWTFYRPQEVEALQWADNHLDHADIWTEFDERMRTAAEAEFGNTANSNGFAILRTSGAMSDYLLSTITRWRSARLDVALPVPADAILTYDNGDSQVYHRRPDTPFGR